MLFVCLGDIIGTDIQLLECVNWDFGDPPPPGVAGIPTLSEWGLIAMAGIFGVSRIYSPKKTSSNAIVKLFLIQLMIPNDWADPSF